MQGPLKVSVVAIAVGLMHGVYFLTLGLLALYGGIGTAWVDLISSIVPSYHTSSLSGILIGSFWGTVCGAFEGLLFALIYNGVAHWLGQGPKVSSP